MDASDAGWTSIGSSAAVVVSWMAQGQVVMGIDVSLYMTRAKISRGVAGEDDVRLAYCRATIPVVWWFFFAPEEVVMGPYGPMMRAVAAQALGRLRRHAPGARAAAGRHALALRHIERELERHPTWWLEAYICELYDSASLDVIRGDLERAQARPGAETMWARLDQGRFVRDASPTQQLSDHIVGAGCSPGEQPASSWDDLVARCQDAFVRGDASELDLLEEALFVHEREALGAFDPLMDAIDPERSLSPEALTQGAARLERWVQGDETALASLSPWQLPGLLEAAKRQPYELGRRVSKRLAQSVLPIEGLIARGLRLSCPMSDALRYVAWERGDHPPIDVNHERAIWACRLVATGSPASPLCLFDPLALVERAVFSRSVVQLVASPCAEALAQVAITRALRLTQEDVATWLRRYPQLVPYDHDEAAYDARLSAGLCSFICDAQLTAQTLAQLRAVQAPQAAALSGRARQLVLLALGEVSCAASLLQERDVDRDQLVLALYASRQLPADALSWLSAQGFDPEVWSDQSAILAALMLLGAGQPGAALNLLDRRWPQQLARPSEAYHEGLITLQEQLTLERALRALLAALLHARAPGSLIARVEAALEPVGTDA